MVIDYRDGRLAGVAQQVLDAAGIPAVYILEKLIAVSDDPSATLLLVHRVTVAPADAARASAILDNHGLLPAPGHEPASLGRTKAEPFPPHEPERSPSDPTVR